MSRASAKRSTTRAAGSRGAAVAATILRTLRVSRLAPLAVVACAMLASAAPASASVKHDLLSTFDHSATPSYTIIYPSGLGFDNSPSASSGQLWVGDGNNGVVERFSASGVYSCEVTGRGTTSATTPSATECDSSTAGTPSGDTGLRSGGPTVAVDQSNGDLYATSFVSGAIDRYDATGAFVARIPLPAGQPTGVVFDAAGDLLVTDISNQLIRKYDISAGTWSDFATGTGLSSFGTLESVAVDLDPSSSSYGNVYVAEGFPVNVVHVFDSSGTFLRQITGTPSGSFSRPSAVGVDPNSGDVYVGDSYTAPPGASSTLVLSQFDAAGQFLGQTQVPLATSAGDQVLSSIAFDTASGNIYVGQAGAVGIYGPGFVAPDLTVAPASNLTPTSVTLNGTVNPDGVQVTDCHFEWGTDTNYGNSAPCVEDPGSGSADVSVHADISGLSPGETYHFRLVASNAGGSNGSGDQSFGTLPRPTVSGARSSNLDANSVDLVAQVNPRGAATTYRFEYGTTTSYGSSTPVQNAGSGTSPVTAAVHLSGLSPNTTYHWRVVAENVAGTTTSRDHTFIYDTGGSPLPDNRAYEQVTPVDKNGSAFDRGFIYIAPPVPSRDGDRVTVNPIQCFAEAEACVANYLSQQGSLYALERFSDGWRPRQLSPPATQYEATSVRSTEADTGQALFAGRRTAADPTELVARLADGGLRRIGAVTAPGVTTTPGVRGVSASTDLSRVVFEESAALLDWPFDQTFHNPNDYVYTVLEYVAGASEPILVGVNGGRGSTDLIGECGTRLNKLSADGRTVIVTVNGQGNGGCSQPAPAVNEIYARIDESVTVKISGRSPDGCTVPQCQSSAPAPATFAAASVDGRRIVFRSAQQLTDDATDGSENLYLYDFSRPAGARLTAISAVASGTPGLGGVAAVNDSGTHVYFVARGALASEPNAANEDPEPGSHNLYLYERDGVHPGGRLVFIAQLDGADVSIWAGNFRATVTPDGRYLLLMSRSDLTDDGADSGATEVYRYDAQTAELTRVSVGERGFNGNGDETGPPCASVGSGGDCKSDALIATGMGGTTGLRSMSDDGRFVFFASPAALTPGATDYEPSGPVDFNTGDEYYRQNLYEWHDGRVSLIAAGRALPVYNSEQFSPLVGTDATGSNVFFKTQASLSGTDTDNGQLDIYTARICTEADPCIKPPVRASACSGDGCQGTPAGTPASPVAATVSFAGPGGSTSSRRLQVRVAKWVRGARFSIRVKTRSAGRITIRGRGIRSRTKTVSRAGTYKLTLSLTPAARRQLALRARRKAGRRSLAVGLRVGFAAPRSKANSVRVRVMVRPTKKHAKTGATK